ncbi:MAG: hypothetical protein AAFV26_09285 [Pseudomonadota bacterium]
MSQQRASRPNTAATAGQTAGAAHAARVRAANRRKQARSKTTFYVAAVAALMLMVTGGYLAIAALSPAPIVTAFLEDETRRAGSGLYARILLDLPTRAGKLQQPDRKTLQMCGAGQSLNIITSGLRDAVRTGAYVRPSLLLNIVDAGGFLACSMARDRKQLCSRDKRAQLATSLRGYFEARRAFKTMRSAYLGALLPHRSPLKAPYLAYVREAGGNGEIKPIHWSKPHPGVAAALADLTQHGYFSRKDFGWFSVELPRNIEPYLEEQRYTNSC